MAHRGREKRCCQGGSEPEMSNILFQSGRVESFSSKRKGERILFRQRVRVAGTLREAMERQGRIRAVIG